MGKIAAVPRLYGPGGAELYVQPEPNELVEARVQRELQGIDSLLGIRWVPRAFWNQKYESFEGRYALICRWPQSDPRWKLYRSGEIGEPFDVLGWFCEDIHDARSVPLEPTQVMEKVKALLYECDNQRSGNNWRRRMARAVEKNQKRRAEVVAEAAESSAEKASEVWYHHTPKVSISKDIGGGNA